jgi:hypothetical protein
MVPSSTPTADSYLDDVEPREPVTVPAGHVEYGDDLDIPDFLR